MSITVRKVKLLLFVNNFKHLIIINLNNQSFQLWYSVVSLTWNNWGNVHQMSQKNGKISPTTYSVTLGNKGAWIVGMFSEWRAYYFLDRYLDKDYSQMEKKPLFCKYLFPVYQTWLHPVYQK